MVLTRPLIGRKERDGGYIAMTHATKRSSDSSDRANLHTTRGTLSVRDYPAKLN